MLYKITNLESEKSYETDNDQDANDKSFDREFEVEILVDDGTAFKDSSVCYEKNQEVH